MKPTNIQPSILHEFLFDVFQMFVYLNFPESSDKYLFSIYTTSNAVVWCFNFQSLLLGCLCIEIVNRLVFHFLPPIDLPSVKITVVVPCYASALKLCGILRKKDGGILIILKTRHSDVSSLKHGIWPGVWCHRVVFKKIKSCSFRCCKR